MICVLCVHILMSALTVNVWSFSLTPEELGKINNFFLGATVRAALKVKVGVWLYGKLMSLLIPCSFNCLYTFQVKGARVHQDDEWPLPLTAFPCNRSTTLLLKPDQSDSLDLRSDQSDQPPSLLLSVSYPALHLRLLLLSGKRTTASR